IRDFHVTGVQTCALPISRPGGAAGAGVAAHRRLGSRRHYYDLGAAPVTEPPEPYELVMTAAQWDGIVEFAEAPDFKILFTLNAEIGRASCRERGLDAGVA